MQNAPVSQRPVVLRPGGTWATPCLTLLWIAWVVVPAAVALEGLQLVVTFLGDSATDAEQAHARSLFVRAAVLAVVIPVVGLVVGLATRRRGNAIASGVAVALSGLVALVVAVAAAAAVPEEVPPREPTGCQEHSGGDSDCPGG
ncbi:hypothetical protein [Blastococcus sp. TF02A-26]|uniref:hypothetical protein n=1 Tax=Blastococcus sp. TF02A-26 TaxID=2250577 RepID=UPI000DE8E2E6|nr:hypothetical protein [Blastococcus sp. TF02A-26]RBY81881.1 hypothetical protein DQ240_19560 [Blastococcus sp. TF02A-26]